MLTRRWKLTTTLALAALVGIAGAALLGRANGGEPAAPLAAAAKKKTDWQTALAKLNAGNAHFCHNEPLPVDLSGAAREKLSGGQDPYAIVLTCADSRVAPEHIFGAGLGELFVVRVAGNVVDPVVMGSIEYAVHHLHVHLIVVLGHSSCGAVKARIAPPADASEALAALLEHVHTGDVTSVDHLDEAIHANTEWQTGMLLHSSVIEHALKEGETKPDTDDSHTVHIVSGVYDLATGEAKLQPFVQHAAAGR